MLAAESISIALEGWMALAAVAIIAGSLLAIAIRKHHVHLHLHDETQRDDDVPAE